jgi:cell division protein FtsX
MRYVIYTVRTAGPPLALTPAVRAVIADIDRTVPVFDVATIEDRVLAASARERLALHGTGISGIASVIVVATSLAGLVLLTLLQRRREIGVRKAVGATDAGLRWLLLRGALGPAALGMLAGIAAVIGGLRVPASLLHGGISAVAPLVPTAAALLLLVLAAGILASRRVANVQPTEALRAE